VQNAKLIVIRTQSIRRLQERAHFGTVELSAIIGEDGKIQQLIVVSGHALLRQAALDAVKQWV